MLCERHLTFYLINTFLRKCIYRYNLLYRLHYQLQNYIFATSQIYVYLCVDLFKTVVFYVWDDGLFFFSCSFATLTDYITIWLLVSFG